MSKSVDMAHISFKVPETLYLAYKKALLEQQLHTGKRHNVTQDVTAHMRRVAERYGTLPSESDD